MSGGEVLFGLVPTTPAAPSPVKSNTTAAHDPLAGAVACACGDRPAAQCDEEWGPECDLGNNEAHCRPARQRVTLNNRVFEIVPDDVDSFEACEGCAFDSDQEMCTAQSVVLARPCHTGRHRYKEIQNA